MAFWTPQPGPQVEACTCPADEVLFGGSRGGGKSDALIGRQLRGAERYGHDWNGIIFRRHYKDFAEIRRRYDSMIAQGLPAERTGGEQQPNFINYENGGKTTLIAIKELAQLDAYQGHQYTEVGIDEVTTFPFVNMMIDKCKGFLRSAAGVPCRMFLTGNPGGPGHMDVRTRYIDPVPAGSVYRDSAGESRVYIPSFLKDNTILCENDPKYVRRLMSIQDPALRKAWLEGDWTVFIGQAFGFNPLYHIVKPLQIPHHAPLYMTYDYGFGKPFSIGWWWTDYDNRIYRFMEWYGCEKNTDGIGQDIGLRLDDSDVARGIIEREKNAGIWGRDIVRLCDPTSFNKKPDFQGGGQGPSTADVFADHGLYLSPGDPNRLLKIRQFRERLRIPRREDGTYTGEAPMLQVYESCRDFIRTIPALCMDEKKPEDIDTDMEDHVYDEACHVCMNVTIPLEDPMPKVPTQAMIDYEVRTGKSLHSTGGRKAFNVDD